MTTRSFRHNQGRQSTTRRKNFLTKFIGPPTPLIILQRILTPRIININRYRPHRTTRSRSITSTNRPTIRLLTNRRFRFVHHRILFNLRLILFRFMMTRQIFHGPLITRTMRSGITRAIRRNSHPIITTTINNLRRRIRTIRGLMIRPFSKGILNFTTLNRVLFRVTRRPLMFIYHTLHSTRTRFNLPPLRVINGTHGRRRHITHQIRMTLFSLHNVNHVTLNRRFKTSIRGLRARLIRRFVSFLHGSTHTRRTFLFLIPRFKLTLTVRVRFLPRATHNSTNMGQHRTILFQSSFSRRRGSNGDFLSRGS